MSSLLPRSMSSIHQGKYKALTDAPLSELAPRLVKHDFSIFLESCAFTVSRGQATQRWSSFALFRAHRTPKSHQI